MISKIKDLFVYERENALSLLQIRTIVEGETGVILPSLKSAEISDKKENEKKSEVSDSEAIISFIAGSGEPLSSSEILEYCLENDICSRATFFRKLKDLVKSKEVKKVRKGKNCYYLIKD